MVIWPSAFQTAVAAWGSMYPWCTVAVVTSCSTTTSARWKALSGSPSTNWKCLATLEWMSVFWPSESVVRSSCRRGAPSRMASRTSVTGGRTS